ncbi:acyltransferase family protein [Kitasatospora sp. NPDC048194]|uniref:acyltransferase family protein n=1 Tax=Kitasatospora sp. NPDC048194 TaxID=3364045 RepID=UPI003713722F
MRIRQLLTPLAARRSRGAAAGAAQSRLGWLDAVRGIAAFAVVLQHFDIWRLVPWGNEVWVHFDFGLYGVMTFFLVSGYIIPASLERRGDVRAFWLGRIFRIHPALIVTIVICLLTLPDEHMPVLLLNVPHVPTVLTANAMMLQDMLGQPNSLRVMWTLSFEMVFYFMVTALFVRGWHRRTSGIAVGLAAGALLLGVTLTQHGLSTGPAATTHLVMAVALLVGSALVFIMTGRTELVRTGALLLGVVGVVLAFQNGRAIGFETFMVFATMFAGTVVYRAENGQIDRLQGWLVCGFVVAAGVLVGWLYNRGANAEATWTSGWMAWCNSYVLAWATFGVAMLFRKRRFPRPLTWLGAISFSMYLVHVPVLYAVDGPLLTHPTVASPASQKVVWVLGYLACVLVASQLLYTLVEMPMQKLGRKVIKRLNAFDARRAEAVALAATVAAAVPAARAEGEGPEREQQEPVLTR